MEFSLYDLYKENKDISDHNKLKIKFNKSLENLSDTEQSTIKWGTSILTTPQNLKDKLWILEHNI